ncbi:hypothetical protein [Rickettsiales endosymbiont of Trichoplax sp. H2]|uniref:hypothetical protein n=1 Tax=Rickettsiales endosymbiont of Trichoplax sp. H2 TaxID=2021221 RepID=UPI0012B35497|nr:hypothetical protein [Rickettsiales endosymbiont of Trichoplax sp. H2]MSO14250.1 hypothetical protein [Rickettsiales endosymbiont of Trichoplax sp. H2]
MDGTNGFKIILSSINFGLTFTGDGAMCYDIIIGAPYSNTSFVIFGQEHFFDDEVVL